MLRLLFLIILSVFSVLSCERKKELLKEGISFYFSDNLKKSSQERISSEILFQRHNLGYPELQKISIIRIDSVPFSYIFYVPFYDSITNRVQGSFEGFAAMLSSFNLDSTQVHIILTDKNYNPKKVIQFNSRAIEVIGEYIRTKRTHIQVDKNVPPFQPEGMEFILLDRLSELYKSKDLVRAQVKKVNNRIQVIITVDMLRVNADTLNSQFLKMEKDRLPWEALFGGRPIEFIFIDTTSKKIKTG